MKNSSHNTTTRLSTNVKHTIKALLGGVIAAPLLAWACQYTGNPNGLFADSFEAAKTYKPRPPIDVSTCKQTLGSNDDVRNPTVWKDLGSGCDYYLSHDVSISSDLTIAPGVTIVMAKTMDLNIDSGTLTAIGTPEKRIQIIGEKDERGYWGQVEIDAGKVTLDYVDIANGGSACSQPDCLQTNVRAYDGSEFSMRHSSVSSSQYFGLALEKDTTVTAFSENAFCDNRWEGVYAYPDIVQNLTANNDFTGGNRPNDDIGIWLKTTFFLSGDVRWPNLGVPYRFDRNIHKKSGRLTIEPGTQFILDEKADLTFDEAAYLTAIGTAEAPIIFSAADSNKGWRGITFDSDGAEQSILEYVHISHGGNRDVGWSANIKLDSASIVNIRNSQLNNSKSWGVDCVSGTQHALRRGPNVTFANNAKADIDSDCKVINTP